MRSVDFPQALSQDLGSRLCLFRTRRTIDDDLLAYTIGCGTRSCRVNCRDYNMACEKATSFQKETGAASTSSKIISELHFARPYALGVALRHLKNLEMYLESGAKLLDLNCRILCWRCPGSFFASLFSLSPSLGTFHI